MRVLKRAAPFTLLMIAFLAVCAEAWIRGTTGTRTRRWQARGETK